VESEFKRALPDRIQGQILRLSEHRVVAIYLRDGSIWVADFIDGQGMLVDANTWFRFNCGTNAASQALRRMTLESAIPLSVELVEQIEALHRPAALATGLAAGLRRAVDARQRRSPWRSLVRALRRAP
jgi:hypothetical protein